MTALKTSIRYIISFTALSMALLSFAESSGQEQSQPGFQIHIYSRMPLDADGSRSPWNSFHLHTYDYDESWHNFLNNGKLEDAMVIIDAEDIQSYDPSTFETVLFESGIKKLERIVQTTNSSSLRHFPFIVTVNGERLFAGEFLSPISAMSIRHPVIHFFIEFKQKKPFLTGSLRILRYHSVTHYAGFPELADVFKKMDKLHTEEANNGKITFEGVYRTGRSACIWNADGSREWFITYELNVTKLVQGKLGPQTVQLDNEVADKYAMEEGKTYRVTLKVGRERMKELENEDTIMSIWESITLDEMVSIDEIKKSE